MSLEGSLQTVALPEVLHLLADTSKSGQLRVSAQGTEGRLWFESGELVAFEVGRCAKTVDAVFELLRAKGGEFVFDEAASVPESAHRLDGSDDQDLLLALEEAEARLEEWHDIVEAVPSLEHDVFLVEEAPRKQVVVDAAQWSMLVAVGEGRRVQDVLDQQGLTEFAGCKSIKGLVDAGLVEVFEPAETDQPAAAAVAVGAASEPVEAHNALGALINGKGVAADAGDAGRAEALDDRGPWTATELDDKASSSQGDLKDTLNGESDSESHSDDEASKDGSEPINRGLLLKFLSSVRS